MVEDAVILTNTLIAGSTYLMQLLWPGFETIKPGQFVEIAVPGFFLRRPISVCRKDNQGITIIYKVVGDGTDFMSSMLPGETLSVFGPLGHGFSTNKTERPVLAGGGVGVPPLYELAKTYVSKGIVPVVVLGFQTAGDRFLIDDFQALGCPVYTATMDGSAGIKGTVVDAIEQAGIEPEYIQACGPLPMLKAINSRYPKGEISLESRMACGFGACMGCVVKDVQGHAKRVCKDGPVFEIGKVELA